MYIHIYIYIIYIYIYIFDIFAYICQQNENYGRICLRTCQTSTLLKIP